MIKIEDDNFTDSRSLKHPQNLCPLKTIVYTTVHAIRSFRINYSASPYDLELLKFSTCENSLQQIHILGLR